MRAINAVCPGTRIEGAERARLAPQTPIDPVWGPIAGAVRGHAADPVVRHRAASGGVTTALAQFLLDSGRVELVVQVGAVVAAPMRTERRLSFDRLQVLDATGSRYGPAAPLRELHRVLERGRPFALVGKPCDIGAARNLARVDARADRLMRYTLAVVCGGASELDQLEAAVAAGVISVLGPLTARQLDHFNPPQVARKRAAGPRLAALRAAGQPVPRVRRLRTARLALHPRRVVASVREFLGARERVRDGRLGERDVVEVGPAPEPANAPEN
ncbi:MAG TPA: coenzyme F420 hydrogenase/dehydrogenase beta subunit N-terminal domain-containing protein [Solirubrobacteraceae bacterium]|nr:coenzyme F420 hydrogenase/dehydrogenase beta subunit N-terminal domain-containing protein [Solirubrobacteraceae bacterium]